MILAAWPARFLALGALLCNNAADAAQYVVNGFALGQRVARNSSDYRAYTCQPSEDFAEYILCRRERVNTSQGKSVLQSAILHDKAGTAIYLMANVAPVSTDRQSIESEISQLSKKFDQQPAKVDWFPQRNEAPTSVVVLWGRTRLQPIKIAEDELKYIKSAADIAPDISPGLLVDPLGDPVRSAKAGLPVYRIAGGAGFIYSASFDASSRGHRLYVAVDVSPPAIKRFEPELRKALQEDQSRASNDYGAWPDLASAARNLALLTSPEIANEQLDQLFARYPSTKLRSHVWPLLPLGTISSLAVDVHWAASTYGARTKYPEIRTNILAFLAEHPSEPFSELLYYTVGEFDKSLQAKPKSLIDGAVRYAIGHRILASLLQEAAKAVNMAIPDIEAPVDAGPTEPVNDTLVALNRHPERYGHKLLSDVVPTFAAQAAAAQPWFEAVLRDPSSPQQDDAAYILGWLAFHQGKFKQALDHLAQAMTLANHDYKLPAAVKQTIRILSRFSPREQATMVASSPVFSQQPALWYVAARSAYRLFDFDQAVETGERGLKALNLSPDQVPATTDPERIKEAIEKSVPRQTLESEDFDEIDLTEIPYIVEASKEIARYQTFLRSVETAAPGDLAQRARAIVQKYSLLLDKREEPRRGQSAPGPVHKDLRQAIHLIDTTLNRVPRNAAYVSLREWLHYRKIRILVQFDPEAISAAVAVMEAEFPKSPLLDDALAEQLYAQGLVIKDVPAAEKTFRKLVDNFPGGNAVDNAYTWMAIIYRCAGKIEQAQQVNMEILRRFPLTRHARYARERIAHPKECKLNEEKSD